MKYFTCILTLSLIFILSSCYNARVITNKKPSGKKIEKKWAHSFINGLVPPRTINTAKRCPNGVAKVETKLRFLNQLVAVVTSGIYTPMDIEVSCAASPSATDTQVNVDSTARISASMPADKM